MKLKRLLAVLVAVGMVARIFVALRFQSRAWIDELWVTLNPAFHLLTGTGFLNPEDWVKGIRSWVPPGVLFVFLSALDLVGIRNGTVVLPLVRVAMTLFTAAALWSYARVLATRFRMSLPPLLPVFVLFFVPEFIHYSTTADLSVLGLPFLLLGLALSDTPRRRIGDVLLCFSALVRFQYGVFPFCLFLWRLRRGATRHALELALIGAAALAFDAGLGTALYGRPVFPLWNYLRANTLEGVASGYGVTPFYLAFEILWRFSTEPVYALMTVMAVYAYRRAPFLTLTSYLFFVLHAVVPHKEYRFFYGPAVLLSGLSVAAFQSWLETRLVHRGRIDLSSGWSTWRTAAAGAAFVLAFVGFAGWRAVKKVRWADYEVPSKLETMAGSRRDFRGLITYGWNGVYQGGNFTTYSPQPYAFAQRRSDLAGLALPSGQFNYVVTATSEPPPCHELVRVHRGAALYRCVRAEVEALVGSSK